MLTVAEEETIEELQNLEIEGEVLTEEEDLYSVDEILQNTQMNQYIDNETDMTEGYEFSKEDWNLLLVNKQHPIPENHTN